MDSDNMGGKIIDSDGYSCNAHELIVCSCAIYYWINVGNTGGKREKIVADLHIAYRIALFIGAIEPDGVISGGDRLIKGLQSLVIA